MKKVLIGIIMVLVFAVTALAADVTLQWDPNSEPDLAGYKIYYGTASRTYGGPIDVGNVTQHTVRDLEPGIKYFFAATAYNEDGYESDYSNEVMWGVPTAPGNFRVTVTVTVEIGGDQ
jgi:uncharacterized protein YxeA